MRSYSGIGLLITLCATTLSMSASGPAPEEASARRFTFERKVANVEYAVLPLGSSKPDSVKFAPELQGEAWYGLIERKIPGAQTADDLLSPAFLAEYVEGRSSRVWCDANMDGDLTNDPPLKLWAYPDIPDARSFLLDLNWTVRHGTRDVPVDWKIRVVLAPKVKPTEPPTARIQSVYAMTGSVNLEGSTHRAILYDGNRDGLYTQESKDGMFVDLKDDGHYDINLMSLEFAPFSVPFQMGGRMYEVASVDPEGKELTLREEGVVPSATPLAVGKPAPLFGYRDTAGHEVRLEDYRGRYALVYFWASWCGACEEQAPAVKRFYGRFHPAGLEILGVSFDTKRDAMESFRKLQGQSWPTSFSGHMFWEDPVGRLYGASKLGHFYLVDREGRLEGIYNDPDLLETHLASLIKTDPPAGR